MGPLEAEMRARDAKDSRITGGACKDHKVLEREIEPAESLRVGKLIGLGDRIDANVEGVLRISLPEKKRRTLERMAHTALV